MIGFNEPLYILPFDHRESFQTKMFGWTGTLSPSQTAEIASTKQVITNSSKKKSRSEASGRPRRGTDRTIGCRSRGRCLCRRVVDLR
jgi:hypothetical protein